MTGKFGNLGYGVQQGSSVLSEKFQGMSPEWHKEHESVFALAQNEAMDISIDVRGVKVRM